MDNRNWYKKFGTIFWWVLTILPLIVAIIYFVGYHLTFNSGINSSSDLTQYHESFNSFASYFSNNYVIKLSAFIPSFILTPIDNLFVTIFDTTSNVSILTISCIFAWAVWVQLIHLFYDVVIWIPNFCHKLICKFGGE